MCQSRVCCTLRTTNVILTLVRKACSLSFTITSSHLYSSIHSFNLHKNASFKKVCARASAVTPVVSELIHTTCSRVTGHQRTDVPHVNGSVFARISFCPNCLIGIPGFLVSTAMCHLLLLCDIGCIGLCSCFGACNDTCGDCWTYRGYIDRTGCVCYVEDGGEMGARVMRTCKD